MRVKSVRLTSQVWFFILSAIGVTGITMSGVIYPYYYCYAGPQAVGLCPLGILQHGFMDFRIDEWGRALALLGYLFGFFGVLSLLLGRAVCGWACPVGFIQEFFAWPGKGRARGFGDGMEPAPMGEDGRAHPARAKPKFSIGGAILVAMGAIFLAWAFAGAEVSLLKLIIGAILVSSGLGLIFRPYMRDRLLHWDRPGHEPFEYRREDITYATRKRGVAGGIILALLGLILMLYRIGIAYQGHLGPLGEGSGDEWAAIGLGAVVAGTLLAVAFGFGLSRARFGLLVIIPVVSFWSGATLYTDLDPVGMITGTIPFLAENDRGWARGEFFVAKLVLTGLFFVSAALVCRFWCRFICPLGAMMSPFNKVSVLKLRLDNGACIDCKQCERVCPTRVAILPADRAAAGNSKVVVRDERCILCGRCVDVCPTRAISMDFAGREWKGKGRPGKKGGAKSG